MHIRVSRDEGDTEEEFCKDAAERPDVDCGGVESCSKEKLGGPVPSGNYVVGHWSVRVA